MSKRMKKEDEKVWAFLATFLSIIGFLIAVIVKRENKYVMFYAAQSLVVFVFSVLVGVVGEVVGWIPVTGWIVKPLLGVISFLAWLISWIYALSGEKKEVPIIGCFGKKIGL